MKPAAKTRKPKNALLEAMRNRPGVVEVPFQKVFPQMAKRKPRKPKAIRTKYMNTRINEGSWAEVNAFPLAPEEARRLAAWLIRFAEWAEGKSK